MSYPTRSSETRREIDEAVAEGWKVESETPERVVLVKRTIGSLWVHLGLALLTGWWAFGLFNLVYGAYAYLNHSQRRILRTASPCPECGGAVSDGASYCQHCGADLGTPVGGRSGPNHRG